MKRATMRGIFRLCVLTVFSSKFFPILDDPYPDTWNRENVVLACSIGAILLGDRIFEDKDGGR